MLLSGVYFLPRRTLPFFAGRRISSYSTGGRKSAFMRATPARSVTGEPSVNVVFGSSISHPFAIFLSLRFFALFSLRLGLHIVQ